MPDVLESIRGN